MVRLRRGSDPGFRCKCRSPLCQLGACPLRRNYSFDCWCTELLHKKCPSGTRSGLILKDAQWEGWEGRRPPKKHSHSHQFCFSGRGNTNTRHSQNHKHTIWQGFTMEAQVIYLEKLHPLFDQIPKRNCDGFPCVLSLVPLMASSKCSGG